MSAGRFGACLLAVLALFLAGCGGPGDSQALSAEERVLQTTGVRGIVTDDVFVPIEDALVTLRTDDRQVRTGPDGAYEFLGLEAGEHVLSVTKYGFEPRHFRVQVWATAIAELDMPLEPVPTGEPYHKIFPFAGFITCQAAVGTAPQDTVWVECGGDLAVQEDQREQSVAFEYGTFRVLSELAWEPIHPAAKRLTFAMADGREGAQSEPVHVVQQGPGARVFMVRGTLERMFPEEIGVVAVTVQASPSIDEHSCCQVAFALAQHPPISFGLAFQQEFEVFSTVFHFSHGAPGFTALPAA